MHFGAMGIRAVFVKASSCQWTGDVPRAPSCISQSLGMSFCCMVYMYCGLRARSCPCAGDSTQQGRPAHKASQPEPGRHAYKTAQPHAAAASWQGVRTKGAGKHSRAAAGKAPGKLNQPERSRPQNGKAGSVQRQAGFSSRPNKRPAVQARKAGQKMQLAQFDLRHQAS